MKFLVLSKKQFISLCAAFMAVVTAVICSVGALAKTERKLPIYCVDTPDKKIALSFDAAWGNDDTGTLIEILARYNAKATFFVVGEWVDKYPQSVKQLADAGHQIQNHSATHPYMSKISKEQMVQQLTACNEKIAKITGVTPTLFRPPYGDYSNSVIEAVESVGMYTIQWDVDSLDWKDTATPESITKNVLNKVKNGSIVLFHNDADHTPAALPGILEQLQSQGYEFVFINDLIYKENYEIKHDGTQCKIENNNQT